MMIEAVRLHNFRNYEDLSLSFPQAIILLYGANGQGKTNLLEALYLGGLGKSYRGMKDTDLIRWQADSASLILHFRRQDTAQQLKIILSRHEKKEIWINETKVPRKELVGTLNEVLFSPDDLQLIKGAPSLRRRFLDREISQANPAYYRDLLQYNRAVAQRNLLLKQRKRGEVHPLAEWDRQIAVFAASLVRKRLESLHKLSFLAGVLHKRLSGGTEHLSIMYLQPYASKGKSAHTEPEWYMQRLKEQLPEDIQRQSTSIGPHRDDLQFLADGVDLKRYGSQGQQRTAVLALKLAELEYIKSETGEYPVLLLDDVMSELDKKRRQALLDFVRGRIQTFITTTEPEIFTSLLGMQAFYVEKGEVAARGHTHP